MFTNIIIFIELLYIGLLMFMGRFSHSHTDVESRKHGEDESLDVRHEAFQHIDEDREENRDSGAHPANNHTAGVAEDEDNHDKAQHHNVARRHVGKKTDEQHNRFGEHTDHLDERHQRENLQPSGNARSVEDIDPIMLVATDIGDEESDECERSRHSNIARDICAGGEERNQAQAVAEKDKEKGK